MNSFFPLMLTWIDNLIANPFEVAIEPYTNLIGVDFFMSWILLTIGGALYLGEHSKSTLIGYFFIVFLFLAVTMSSILLVIFGLIAALLTTSMLYNSLIVKRGR